MFLTGERAASQMRLSTALGKVSTPLVLGMLAAIVLPSNVQAHTGTPPTPGSIWTAWNWDPLLVLLLLLVTTGYFRGTLRIWARTGPGRGVRAPQVAAFAGAVVLLVVAVISPLDALGEALFSAHMVQHLLLMLVVAPLLVFARPWLAILWSLPRTWRRTLGQYLRGGTTPRRFLTALTTPLSAWTLHLIAIWVWHIPVLYEAAIHSWLVHLVEHGMFLGSAMLFWWSVLPMSRLAGSARLGLAVLSLFATALHSGLLAAIITFSREPWYASHARSITEAWGLSPLQDQQLAGVIMWVPMGAVYTIAAAVVLGLLLQRLGHDEPEYAAPAASDRPPESL